VDIPFNQCEHFNEVESFGKLWFLQWLSHI
jgi:hypothetical protein